MVAKRVDKGDAISIHAPREGGDLGLATLRPGQPAFQSTPPARGATYYSGKQAQVQVISIHAPREGGDRTPTTRRRIWIISIHAPREGGDTIVICACPP